MRFGKRKADAEARPQGEGSSRLALGAGIAMGGTMVGRGLSVLGQIALARLLGPEAFGLYALGWTIYRIVGRVGPLGLEQGTVRYAPRYRSTDPSRMKGLLLQSLGISLLSGLAMASAFFLCAPWLAEGVFNKPELTSVIRWFSPAFLLVPVLKVAVAATRVSQRMKYAVYAEHLVLPAVNLLFILAFFFLGWGLLGAVAALWLSVGTALILALYYVKSLFPKVLSGQVASIRISREVLTFSLVASFAGVFAAVSSWVDRLLVGYFQPAADLGVYQAVSQFSILFAAIIGAFNTIFSPMIADLHQRGEMEQLNELFKVSTKWGLYTSLPIFVVICLAPRDVVLALFGAEYASGALPLVILACAQLVNVGSGSVGLMMVMTGNQKRWLWISGSAFLSTVVLGCLLIPRFGLIGAALATTFSLSVLFFWGLFQVKRRLGIWPYDRRYLKGLLATALTAMALLLLRWADIDFAVLNVALGLVIAHAVFVLTLVVLGLDTEDKEIAQSVWARFRGNTSGRRQDGNV